MPLVLVGTAQTSTPKRRRVPLEGHGTGYTTVPDGRLEATCEVWVDVQALVHMIGDKAIHNRRGVTKLQAGAVTVKAVQINHVPEAGA